MLFIALFLSVGLANSWFPPIWDESCTFTRDDSYNCLKKYVDVNPKDGQITQQEVDEALTRYLPAYLKPMFWFVNTKHVIDNCDYDKNGVITSRDFMLSAETCLPEKRSQCTVQWFCTEAEEQNSHK